jgi:uncharacterized membrane protein YvbJ
MAEEEKVEDTAEIIDNTKAVQEKKPEQEKCPFCGAVVQPTAEKCAKCGKNLRDKKADKQRAINDGTYHDKLTITISIITGAIFLVFLIIAIIGFATGK